MLGAAKLFDDSLDLRIMQQLQRPEKERDWTDVDRMADFWLGRDGTTEVQKEDFRVRLLIKKKLIDKARNRAEQLVRESPGTGLYWMLLTELTTDNEAALKLLDQMQQRFGDSITLRLARGQRIVQSGGDQVAARLQELERNADALPLQDQAKLWEGMAQFYAAAAAYDNAIACGRKLLQSEENNLAICSFIFELAEKSGNLPVMEEMQASMQKIAGKESVEWQLAECHRLIWLVTQGQRDKSTLAEVRRLIETMRASQPDLASVYGLQADVALLEDNLPGAIEALQTAVQKGPGDPRYLQPLADLLIRTRRTEEAQAVLARLPAGQKTAQQALAEIQMLAAKDPMEALQRLESLRKNNPDNVDLLMLTAVAQQAAGQTDEMLTTVKRLTVIQPEAPANWLNYVAMLNKLGRQEEVDTAIKDMQTAVPAEKVPLLLGQCYQAMGELDKAWPYFEQELQKRPDDLTLLQNAAPVARARNDQAEFSRLVDHMIALDRPDADPADRAVAAGARRAKAQLLASTQSLLASTQSYKAFQDALTLLEQNAGPTGQLEGVDLLFWLQCCAARPEADSRKMAVDRLKEVQSRRKLTDGEKAVMADLFKAAGRWNEAQQIMVDLLTANPNNADLMSTYIQWLLERDQLADAAVWIRKLDPHSQNATRFNAIVQVRQGKETEAARSIDGPGSQEPDGRECGRGAAVLAICEDLGQYNPKFYVLAEKLWQRYLEVRPEDVSVLIGFYSRVPKGEKLDKAFALCEQQISKAVQEKQPQIVLAYLTAGLDALQLHKKELPADSPHYARVFKWFDAARQSGANDLELTSKEIYYYNLRGDIAKLETLYRAFLSRSDATDLQKAQIRNNLAFLLAISQRGSEALEVIGDAISELGPRADLLDTRGTAYLSSGNLEAALKDLQAAVSGDDASASMYFHLALAEHKGGKTAEAVKAMEKAQSMGLTEADLETPEVPIYRDLLQNLGPELKKQ